MDLDLDWDSRKKGVDLDLDLDSTQRGGFGLGLGFEVPGFAHHWSKTTKPYGIIVSRLLPPDTSITGYKYDIQLK